MVLEFCGEQAGVLAAFGGGGGLVDSPDGFFSVPCVAYLPAGVSCLEEVGQFLLVAGVEKEEGLTLSAEEQAELAALFEHLGMRVSDSAKVKR